MDYDEKYDMAAGSLVAPPCFEVPNSVSDNAMQGAGFEPACPKAPDPKSHRSPSPSDSGTAPIEGGPAGQRPETPDAAESTTDSTTDGGSDDEPPSSVRPVPILARTPESTCGSCGAVAYWSVEEFTGLNVLVSIDGANAIAPTRYHEGIGILHVCAPGAAGRRPRALELL